MPNYDQVNLVNDRDQVLGTLDKLAAHKGKGILHQAISLFMFKKNDLGNWQLLMQQRSLQKIVGAKQWANTVCGNVAAGETHQQCVLRRLDQELGLLLNDSLQSRLQELMVFSYFVACNEQYSEREIDHLFALKISEAEWSGLSLQPEQAEVQQTAWVDWQALMSGQISQQYDFAPWFALFLRQKKIVASVEQFLSSNH